VYITTSDELQNFDLHFSYREYFNHRINKSLIIKPSKLSYEFTIRNKIIDKDYFDNLITNRFYDIFLSSNFVLPKIHFLEKYGYYKIDRNIEIIISNEKYNTHENENQNENSDEAIMLIFPPKKFVPEYFGGDLIFMISDKEYRIDTAHFSYEFYTIIIFDKIHVTFEPILKGYRCIFKTIIKYNENMIIEI
jgi:hypothetical protein